MSSSEVYNVNVVDAKPKNAGRRNAVSKNAGALERTQAERSLLRLGNILAEIACTTGNESGGLDSQETPHAAQKRITSSRTQKATSDE